MFVITVNRDQKPVFTAELHAGRLAEARTEFDDFVGRFPANEGWALRLIDRMSTITPICGHNWSGGSSGAIRQTMQLPPGLTERELLIAAWSEIDDPLRSPGFCTTCGAEYFAIRERTAIPAQSAVRCGDCGETTVYSAKYLMIRLGLLDVG
tara:strand:+ start:393 stop:848 length:456 start_codon:yes stop_codon:yes gene_type:complete